MINYCATEDNITEAFVDILIYLFRRLSPCTPLDASFRQTSGDAVRNTFRSALLKDLWGVSSGHSSGGAVPTHLSLLEAPSWHISGRVLLSHLWRRRPTTSGGAVPTHLWRRHPWNTSGGTLLTPLETSSWHIPWGAVPTHLWKSPPDTSLGASSRLNSLGTLQANLSIHPPLLFVAWIIFTVTSDRGGLVSHVPKPELPTLAHRGKGGRSKSLSFSTLDLGDDRN